MMRIMAFLALGILLANPAWGAAAKPQKALDVAVYFASEFDGAATYAALRDCGSACYESNPMIRPYAETPAIFPVMLASAWSINRIAKSLRGRHSRIAKALQVAVVGIHIYAGANNLRWAQASGAR